MSPVATVPTVAIECRLVSIETVSVVLVAVVSVAFVVFPSDGTSGPAKRFVHLIGTLKEFHIDNECLNAQRFF